MHIKSWYLAAAGYLLYLSVRLYVVGQYCARDCAFAGDNCIGCGGPTPAECNIGCFLDKLGYFLGITFFMLMPILALRQARIGKVGAILSTVLSLWPACALFDSKAPIAGIYELISLASALLFLAAGAFYFLKENNKRDGGKV